MKKEDVIKARENNEDLLIEIDEHCIMCWTKKEWEYSIVKIPEWILFCLDCADNHNDENEYSWIDWWRWVYRIWFWFVEEVSQE